MKDPVVDEVRANRDALARECGYDLKKLLAREKRFFVAWKGKKVTESFHPKWEPSRAAVVAEGKSRYVIGKQKGA